VFRGHLKRINTDICSQQLYPSSPHALSSCQCLHLLALPCVVRRVVVPELVAVGSSAQSGSEAKVSER
jgi:hypothetical protein